MSAIIISLINFLYGDIFTHHLTIFVERHRHILIVLVVVVPNGSQVIRIVAVLVFQHNYLILNFPIQTWLKVYAPYH